MKEKKKGRNKERTVESFMSENKRKKERNK